jgi:diguanylate cyclase (GGDEF)-like protein
VRANHPSPANIARTAAILPTRLDTPAPVKSVAQNVDDGGNTSDGVWETGGMDNRAVRVRGAAHRAAPWVWRLTVAGGLAAAGMAIAMPEAAAPVAAGAGLAIIVALGGSLPNRGRRALSWAAHEPWTHLGLAIVLLATAELLRLGDGPGHGVQAPLWCALGAHVLMVTGVHGLLRRRVQDRAWEVLIESAIGAGCVAFLGWVLVLEPMVGEHGASLGASLVLLTLAAVDLTVLFAALRLRSISDVDQTPVRLVCLAAAALLMSHGARLAGLVAESPDRPASAVALVGLSAAAAAIVHPSLRLLCIQVSLNPAAVRSHRLGMLFVAVGVGPVLILLDGRAGLDTRSPAVAIGSALLSVLSVAYLSRLVGTWGRIEHHVHHDELTKLPNRSLFHERLGLALAHARRSDSILAVLFLDLDRFKVVNDSLGHAAGNQLLQGVAARLQKGRKPADTVARLGGDEFGLLLPDVASFDEAAEVAEAVLEAFREPFVVGRQQLHVSPSIGIAHFPHDGLEPERLLRNADAAMYRAKDRGRNTYRLYTPDMNANAADRLSLESDLHRAIERNELVVHYQPKVDLRTGQITGAEALVRWDHPRLGVLPPDHFIPLAEESGFILPLGEWVLEEACRQAKRWQDLGFPGFSVAVNLSPRQFQMQQVSDVVASVLRRTELAPERLEVEVTEGLALHEPDEVTSTLTDLQAMGVRCSIDDFGTGYSGLSYLDRFPVSGLKIDKCFVQAIEAPGGEAPIVRAVIAMAKGLLLDVVAEGVETDAQLEFLRANGCDQIQGFLFSQPVPAHEFEVLLMLERVSPGPGRIRAGYRPPLRTPPAGLVTQAPVLVGSDVRPAGRLLPFPRP